MDFGLQVEASPRESPRYFFQVAAKRRPRGAQEAPRASQGRLKSLQQPPKSAQERPKRAQGAPKVPPEGHFFEDFLVLQRFSSFFYVFLRFSVFVSHGENFSFFCLCFALTWSC